MYIFIVKIIKIPCRNINLAFVIFRSEYKLGNPVNLNVIQTAETALQNKYPPTQQYVTRRNEVALLDKKVELFCIYGGT